MADATQPRIPTSASAKSFANAKRMALEQANSGKLKEALATLTVFYGAQDLTSDQQSDLVDLLDALAREVIFSQRHLLEVPYVINPGETLEQVAKTCQVPVSILARINGLDEQANLAPDRKLKVIQGPFRAEIVLDRSEMTLFLGDLYAGRYPVSFGSEPAPKPGMYEVQDKQRDRNYYSANGMQIPGKDPRNPFGGYWIDLGEDLCIHGSTAVETGASNMGCISLSPLDAGDVFGMLGRGCQVSIR
jgi:LysM repeat protein